MEEYADLEAVWRRKLVGQPRAISAIVPYIEAFQSGMSPEGRPVGVFFLLGPTGTGKTKTVETLAEILHGSQRNVLKIDCAEFQHSHEVSKLIGAPPGYLGHRETQPMQSQQKLASVTSDRCALSLVLFDEVEKGHPSSHQLLLAVLDKGTLRLGDNSTVDFEKSLVFFTSNLGSLEMQSLGRRIGFHAQPVTRDRIEGVGVTALRKRFSPEFINRIDEIVSYSLLSKNDLLQLVDNEVEAVISHVKYHLGPKCFHLGVNMAARLFLLEHGTSDDYGARELKRLIHRQLVQRLSRMIKNGKIGQGSMVEVGVDSSGENLSIQITGKVVPLPQLLILLVDSNSEALGMVESEFLADGWKVVACKSVEEARRQIVGNEFDAALIENVDSADEGIIFAVELNRHEFWSPMLVVTAVDTPDETKSTMFQLENISFKKRPLLLVSKLPAEFREKVMRRREDKLARRAAP